MCVGGIVGCIFELLVEITVAVGDIVEPLIRCKASYRIREPADQAQALFRFFLRSPEHYGVLFLILQNAIPLQIL